MSESAIQEASQSKGTRVPLWVKWSYTAFVALLIPYYWQAYGPTNFLYFCDLALLITAVALWRESPLLASMPAVGILVPQAVWQADFLGGLAGLPLTGMTAYMFDPRLSLVARGLSLFHFWLPLVLVWLVWRLGYDRRAWPCWTALAGAVLLVCYLVMPPPPAPADDPYRPVNINYVFGLNDAGPQTWLHPHAYFALLLVGLPLVVFWPTHRLLARWFGDAHAAGRDRD